MLGDLERVLLSCRTATTGRQRNWRFPFAGEQSSHIHNVRHDLATVLNPPGVFILDEVANTKRLGGGEWQRRQLLKKGPLPICAWWQADMVYDLQMLCALIEAHTDTAASVKEHVEALELGIEAEPNLCLHRVRALFEAVHETIAPALGIGRVEIVEFPKRNRQIIKALDFSVSNQPEAAQNNAAITKLPGSINGTVAALAALSDIRNPRHGGALDWRALDATANDAVKADWQAQEESADDNQVAA